MPQILTKLNSTFVMDIFELRLLSDIPCIVKYEM